MTRARLLVVPILLGLSLACSSLTPFVDAPCDTADPDCAPPGADGDTATSDPPDQPNGDTDPSDTFNVEDVLPEDTGSPFDEEPEPAPGPVFAADFETCPDGWVLASPWQCGLPTSGPFGAIQGAGVLATNLAGDYGGNLRWNTATATSPAFDVPAGGATLTFQAWSSFEGDFTIWDGWGVAVIAADGTPAPLTTTVPYQTNNLHGRPAWSGSNGGVGWLLHAADLTPWAGQTIQLRFAMYSDPSVHKPGAYLDDLVVE